MKTKTNHGAVIDMTPPKPWSIYLYSKDYVKARPFYEAYRKIRVPVAWANQERFPLLIAGRRGNFTVLVLPGEKITQELQSQILRSEGFIQHLPDSP